ncbi:MAG TPA: hypothetical protein VGH20_01550 [Myxococcales bacterium]|jgi:hypothetical protein
MYRRDLELAPGSGFRLRRRLSARLFSALLAVAAVCWGVFDLTSNHPWVGAATLALALAFVLQLVRSEMDTFRFDQSGVVRRVLTLRGLQEERLPAQQIRGVHIAFAKGRARAFIETLAGEEVPLVEGEERDVRRIADRLSAALSLPQGLLH